MLKCNYYPKEKSAHISPFVIKRLVTYLIRQGDVQLC